MISFHSQRRFARSCEWKWFPVGGHCGRNCFGNGAIQTSQVGSNLWELWCFMNWVNRCRTGSRSSTDVMAVMESLRIRWMVLTFWSNWSSFYVTIPKRHRWQLWVSAAASWKVQCASLSDVLHQNTFIRWSADVDCMQLSVSLSPSCFIITTSVSRSMAAWMHAWNTDWCHGFLLGEMNMFNVVR